MNKAWAAPGELAAQAATVGSPASFRLETRRAAEYDPARAGVI